MKKKAKLITLLCSVILVTSMGFSAAPVHAEEQAVTASALTKPVVLPAGGRYETSVSVSLSSPATGANIYYTLDGTMPDASSAKYDGTPIVLTQDTNLSVISEKDGVWSQATAYGYIVKTAEQPLLKFVAFSDVHISPSMDEPNHAVRELFTSNFDVISSIFSNPDAIILNGDNINDNWDGQGADHQFVRQIFEEQLERKNWTESTKVQFATGNHDASIAEIHQYYPEDWFTDEPGGYYEKTINGFSFLILNGENYNNNTAQRNWLKARMAAITAEPGSFNKPVFIIIHRPISNTVMDGQQASNPNLAVDLKNYPQAIVLSGHSHYNINDERSIYQKDFTAVNLGSMSYLELERGYQLIYDKEGLVNRFEIPQHQGQFIEVYPDRVEIERVAFNSDNGQSFINGVWKGGNTPPLNSVGTLAGTKWTVKLDGDTPEEIKSNFDYTTRNTVAPAFVKEANITVTTSEEGVSMLSFNQAKDDQMVHHYDISIQNERTGAVVKTLSVISQFFVVPTPTSLDIPLTDLSPATPYTVTVTAVDSYGNKSAKVQGEFRTKGMTYSQLEEKITEAEKFITYLTSTVGVSVPDTTLSTLTASVATAKAITSSDAPEIIDEAYLNLLSALDAGKESITYSFIPKSAFTVESFSSYADNEAAYASNILDGSTSTIWVSKWEEPVAQLPHWVTIDMKESYKLSGIQRTSRRSQSQLEFPKTFELYASDNLADLSDPAYLADENNRATGTFGKTWGGTFFRDFTALDKPVQGRYVKFVVTGTYLEAPYTSMSEIDFTGTPADQMPVTEDIKLFAGDQNVRKGELFTVPVKVSQAATLEGIEGLVQYDPNLLTLESFELQTFKETGAINTTVPGKISFAGVSATALGTNEDAVIAHAVFRAKSDLTTDEQTNIVFASVKGIHTNTAGETSFAPIATKDALIKIISSMIGDLTGDGRIDIMDANALLKRIAQEPTLSDEALKAIADMNGDHTIDTRDVLAILQTIADRLVNASK